MKTGKADQKPTQCYEVIDKHVVSIYNENTKLGERKRFVLDDVLNYVDVYNHCGDAEQEVPAHWHYVSYGLSDAEWDAPDKASDKEEARGYGFELTFRLKRHQEEHPPRWPVLILQAFGEYVQDTGNILSVGDHIPWNKPLNQAETRENQDDPDQTTSESHPSGSLIKHLLITEDPELMTLSTPQGPVQFRQLIGVLDPEIKAAQSWKGCGVLDLISLSPQAGGAYFITDMTRETSVFDHQPYFIQLVGSEISAAGSNLAHVTALCAWSAVVRGDADPGVVYTSQGQPVEEQVLDKVTLYIDTDAAELLPVAARGRLGHGRYFLFENLTGEVILFIPEGCDEPMVSVNYDTPLTAQGPNLQIYCSQDFVCQMAEALDTTFSDYYKHNRMMREIHLTNPQVTIVITDLKEKEELMSPQPEVQLPVVQQELQLPVVQQVSSVWVSDHSDSLQTSENDENRKMVSDEDFLKSSPRGSGPESKDLMIKSEDFKICSAPFDFPPPPPDLLEGIRISEDSPTNNPSAATDAETGSVSSTNSVNGSSPTSISDHLSQKPPIPSRTSSQKRKTEQAEVSTVQATRSDPPVIPTSRVLPTEPTSPHKKTFHITESLTESNQPPVPVVSACQVSDFSIDSSRSRDFDSEITMDMSTSKSVGIDSECYYADEDPSASEDFNVTLKSVLSSEGPTDGVDGAPQHAQVEQLSDVQSAKVNKSAKYAYQITADVEYQKQHQKQQHQQHQKQQHQQHHQQQHQQKQPSNRPRMEKVPNRNHENELKVTKSTTPKEVSNHHTMEDPSKKLAKERHKQETNRIIKHATDTGRHYQMEAETRHNLKKEKQSERSRTKDRHQANIENRQILTKTMEDKRADKASTATHKSHKEDHKPDEHPRRPDLPPKPDHLRQVCIKPHPKKARSGHKHREPNNNIPLGNHGSKSLSISEKLLTGFSDLAGVGDPRYSNVEVPVSSLEYAAVHGHLPSSKFVYHSAFKPYSKEQFFSPRKHPKQKNHTGYGDINLNDTFMSIEDMEWEDLPKVGKEEPMGNLVDFHPQSTSSALSDLSAEELSNMLETEDVTTNSSEVFVEDSGSAGPQTSFTSSKTSGQSKDLSVVVEEAEEDDCATPTAELIQSEFDGDHSESSTRTTTPTPSDIVSNVPDPHRRRSAPPLADSSRETSFDADTSFVILSDTSGTSFDPDISIIDIPTPVMKRHKRRSEPPARPGYVRLAGSPSRGDVVTDRYRVTSRGQPTPAHGTRAITGQRRPPGRGDAYQPLPHRSSHSEPSRSRHVYRDATHSRHHTVHQRSEPDPHHKSSHQSSHSPSASQTSHRPAKPGHQSTSQKYMSSPAHPKVDTVCRQLEQKPSAHSRHLQSSSRPLAKVYVDKRTANKPAEVSSSVSGSSRKPDARPERDRDRSHRQAQGSPLSGTSRRSEPQSWSDSHRTHRQTDVSPSKRHQRPGPDGHRPDSHRSDGHRPESHRPDSHRSDSHRPESHRPDSHRSESHRSDSHRSESHRTQRTAELAKSVTDRPRKPHQSGPDGTHTQRKTSEQPYRESRTRPSRCAHDVSVESTASAASVTSITSQQSASRINTSVDSNMSMSSNLSAPSVRRTPQMFRAEKSSQGISKKQLESSSGRGPARSTRGDASHRTSEIQTSERNSKPSQSQYEAKSTNHRNAPAHRDTDRHYTQDSRDDASSRHPGGPGRERDSSRERHRRHQSDRRPTQEVPVLQRHQSDRRPTQEVPVLQRHQSDRRPTQEVPVLQRHQSDRRPTQEVPVLQRHQSDRRPTQEVPVPQKRRNRASLPDSFTPQMYIQSMQDPSHTEARQTQAEPRKDKVHRSNASLAESFPDTEEEEYKSNTLPRRREKNRSSFKIQNPYSSSTEV